MAQLPKGKLPKPASQIPPLEEIHYGLVSFSFKYLELDHGKFSLPDTAQKGQYLGALFDRLKQVSTMRCQEFRQAHKALRSHQIEWHKTSEPDGFAHMSEQMQGCQPWQFSLARDELGRIHGLWVGTVFYAVWIDHEHQLFPGA